MLAFASRFEDEEDLQNYLSRLIAEEQVQDQDGDDDGWGDGDDDDWGNEPVEDSIPETTQELKNLKKNLRDEGTLLKTKQDMLQNKIKQKKLVKQINANLEEDGEKYKELTEKLKATRLNFEVLKEQLPARVDPFPEVSQKELKREKRRLSKEVKKLKESSPTFRKERKELKLKMKIAQNKIYQKRLFERLIKIGPDVTEFSEILEKKLRQRKKKMKKYERGVLSVGNQGPQPDDQNLIQDKPADYEIAVGLLKKLLEARLAGGKAGGRYD